MAFCSAQMCIDLRSLVGGCSSRTVARGGAGSDRRQGRRACPDGADRPGRGDRLCGADRGRRPRRRGRQLTRDDHADVPARLRARRPAAQRRPGAPRAPRLVRGRRRGAAPRGRGGTDQDQHRDAAQRGLHRRRAPDARSRARAGGPAQVPGRRPRGCQRRCGTAAAHRRARLRWPLRPRPTGLAPRSGRGRSQQRSPRATRPPGRQPR